jgi:hypothetical protein
MRDEDRIDEEYRERSARFHANAERRAQRWAMRRERRAERRAMRWEGGWYDPTGLWGGGQRGPSELTLRLQDMMKQVDDISARVSTLEKIATGSDARLAAEIDRLARGPGASMGR